MLVKSTTAVAPVAQCVLGDCDIQLAHASTYEPPLYLFPELLPRVPRGTAAATVWDGVADAIDVTRSSWSMINLDDVRRIYGDSRCTEAGTCGGPDNLPRPNDEHHHSQSGLSAVSSASLSSSAAPAASSLSSSSVIPTRANRISSASTVQSLAALLASNRLALTGIAPNVLAPGRFSAAAVMDELLLLRSRANLTPHEGVALMSNTFIHLLAWQKLCEINESRTARGDWLYGVEGNYGDAMTHGGVDETARHGTENDALESNEPGDSLHPRVGEKRPRHDKEWHHPHTEANTKDTASTEAFCHTSSSMHRLGVEAELEGAASPDPWSRILHDPSRPGKFIAAEEEDVEQRVALLRTLAALYRRPWRVLRSTAVQTDHTTVTSSSAASASPSERRGVVLVNTTTPFTASALATSRQPLFVMNRTGDEGEWVATQTLRSRWSIVLSSCHASRPHENEGATNVTADVVAPSFSSSTSLGTAARQNRTTGDDREGGTGQNYAHRVDGTELYPRHEDDMVPRRIVPLRLGVATNFGRVDGVQQSAMNGAVDVHVNLGRLSRYPERVSELHFALLVMRGGSESTSNLSNKHESDHNGEEGTNGTLCDGAHLPHHISESASLMSQTETRQEGSSSSSSSSKNNNFSDNVDDKENKGDVDPHGVPVRSDTTIASSSKQASLPCTQQLWLMNYARNGTRVRGHGWVLGEPMRLYDGAELEVATDVCVRVVLSAAAEVTANGNCEDVRTHKHEEAEALGGASAVTGAVKKEHVDEDAE